MSNDPSINKPDDSEIVDNHETLLHEASGAREGSESLPPKLIIFFMALAFIAAGYLFWNSGGFQANVFNPARVAWDGSGSGGAAAAPDPMVLGKKVFTQNCAVCHQANGEGVAGQFPPLVASEWVLSNEWHGDNHLVKIVLNGLQGVVTVKGSQYNNVMAPWGKVLKDDQIAAVLTYVRNEWGNKADPITPEFVAKVREQAKDRNEPWTQKELQTIGRELVSEAAAAAPAPETQAPAPAPAPGT